MPLSPLLLLAMAAPAQAPAPPVEAQPSAWSVGVAAGIGFGFFQGTDRLEAELRQVQESLGETPNASLDERPVRAPSVTLRFFLDRAVLEYLAVGLDLGLFFWDRRITKGFRTQLRDDYGVEPVAAQAAGTAARFGPRLVGRWAIDEAFSAELTVAAGFWLDLASPLTTAGGWFVRPTVAAVWGMTEKLSFRLDAGYIYMPLIGDYTDELRGVELEVGAAWQL